MEQRRAWPVWRGLPARKGAARTELRRSRRARLAAQSASERAEDARALARTLAGRLAGRSPGTLAAYRSLPTEPPTEAIVAAAVELGWRVIMPVLLADKDLSWEEHDAAGTDLGPAAIAQASVIVVPALAIDHRGMRLGQGGGSYDRALARRSTSAWTVAVVHGDELATTVPTERHDRPVDAVLTAAYGVLDLPAPQAVAPGRPAT